MSEQRSLSLDLDEYQYTRLMAEVRRSGRSIHEVVGEAVDLHLQALSRRRAIESLLNAPAVEMGSWEEEKAMMLDEMYRLSDSDTWETPPG